jgi:hypothetical protein
MHLAQFMSTATCENTLCQSENRCQDNDPAKQDFRKVGTGFRIKIL